MTELLSGVPFLGMKVPASELDYVDLVNEGLPVESLEHIVKFVAPTDSEFKFRIVPKATLHRLMSDVRKKTAQLLREAKGGRVPRSARVARLNARQSAVVARLASVWAQAFHVWKSREAAREFLYTNHPLLNGRRPIDLVLENEIGAQLVRGILGRLEHGSAV